MISCESQLVVLFKDPAKHGVNGTDTISTTTTNRAQHPSPKCCGLHHQAWRHVYSFKFPNGQ